MTRALLGLGSNLGDRKQFLRDAVAGLGELTAKSQLYETKPVGGPEQGPYLNLVVAIETDLSPRELLDLCQSLERQAGRVRRIRWGPRTLDVDILWMDGVSVDEPDLTVPHPRMRERAFVMVPLADVAPDVANGWDGVDADGVLAMGEL
jgi:2-amino-4-hydroxy-6-hydroxymethyldihydropteridine diphosphokinase